MWVKWTLSILLVSRVSSWTVDLDEVEKLENSRDENVENDVYYNYAEGYGYQNITVKKVNSTSILSDGSAYLEGLSRALMAYRDTLSNCSQMNFTATENKTPHVGEVSEDSKACQTAARNREYVQRLSDLALLTTNRLRDKAYDKKEKDDPKVENELLLQLAWFLDRLALVTGYEPNPKQYIHQETEATKQHKEQAQNSKASQELLEQVENNRPLIKLPPKNMTAVKSVRKRSVNRNVNDSLNKVLTYYVKYKVWNGANSNSSRENLNFDTENHLKAKSIKKRSVKKKINVVHSFKNKNDGRRSKVTITKMAKNLKFKAKAKVSKPLKNVKQTSILINF
ncbi:unnamed protein product, partial [Brenthis ino]